MIHLDFFCKSCQCPCKVNKFVTAKKHVSAAKRGTAPWQSTLLVDWHVLPLGVENISCRVTFVQVQTSSSLRFWRRQTSRVTLRALIANDISYCPLSIVVILCILVGVNSQMFVILLSKVSARYCKQVSQLETHHDWHSRAAVCILLCLLKTLGYQYVSSFIDCWNGVHSTVDATCHCGQCDMGWREEQRWTQKWSSDMISCLQWILLVTLVMLISRPHSEQQWQVKVYGAWWSLLLGEEASQIVNAFIFDCLHLSAFFVIIAGHFQFRRYIGFVVFLLIWHSSFVIVYYTCSKTSFVTRASWGTCIIPTWNPKQPFINGCFNWMIPNLYIGNGCFTQHPFWTGCLGFQVCKSPVCYHDLSLLITTGPKSDRHPEAVNEMPRHLRSFVAPTALTVFTGSAAAPTPLCSINLEAKKGGVKQFGSLG